MTNPYTFTSNAMLAGVAPANPSTANANLEYLKWQDVYLTKGLYAPYSCVNGNRTGGNADFITKIDDSSIRIESGAGDTPLKMIFPCGEVLIQETDIEISNLTTNTTYIIVKERDGNYSAVDTAINSVTEGWSPPSGGVNNDYYLDIGITPYTPYKKISGVWTTVQFVKLGEVTRAAGTIETPVSYAFNGKALITQTGVVVNSSYTLQHNIGTTNVKHFGVYNNISGSTDPTKFPNGSGGYQIGVGIYAVTTGYQSAIGKVTNKALGLYTDVSAIWWGADAHFSGGDALITVERNF